MTIKIFFQPNNLKMKTLNRVTVLNLMKLNQRFISKMIKN